jgi:cell fate (sporulation/competence/biofilm development) regulator YmcA (YheA/YmcA/DUF963 family)
MTSAEKKKFNLLQSEIEKLKKELVETRNSKDSAWKAYQDSKREIDSIHAALDVLPGIPSKKVKIDEYSTVELTINARLFAWVSSAAFGQKKFMERED